MQKLSVIRTNADETPGISLGADRTFSYAPAIEKQKSNYMDQEGSRKGNCFFLIVLNCMTPS